MAVLEEVVAEDPANFISHWNLGVLKRLFVAAGPGEIEALVRAKPTGSYARRVWFLYEWLTGTHLDLPDAVKGSYVLVVDPKRQWTGPAKNSPRHRVRTTCRGHRNSAFRGTGFLKRQAGAF